MLRIVLGKQQPPREAVGRILSIALQTSTYQKTVLKADTGDPTERGQLHRRDDDCGCSLRPWAAGHFALKVGPNMDRVEHGRWGQICQECLAQLLFGLLEDEDHSLLLLKDVHVCTQGFLLGIIWRGRKGDK